MPASVVYIANLAVSHFGDSATIASMTENTKAARYCNLHYEQARDETLAAFDWSFARKQIALADLGTPPDPWAYRYALPTDCLAARWLVDPSDPDRLPIEFELAANDTLDQACLLTDEPDAVLRYTARVASVALFSPPFILAVSFKLADYVCKPLTGDTKLKAAMQAGYVRALSAATTHDANQGFRDPNRTPDHIAARG